MAPDEAESVKLFSNMFLATRIAFFNELDTFAMNKKLDSASIILGVSLDKRIGNFYNNPSFGFGGYCLPKDAMQLVSDFGDIPNDLISSVLNSNINRKSEIIAYVRKNKITKLGIYKIENKLNSDNFRYSVMLDLISAFQKFNINVFIFDKSLKVDEFQNCKVYSSLAIFKKESEIILANRMSKELMDVKDKVFSRDIFNRN
jgi:UDPglucose 6-dehydrogenase